VDAQAGDGLAKALTFHTATEPVGSLFDEANRLKARVRITRSTRRRAARRPGPDPRAGRGRGGGWIFDGLESVAVRAGLQ